MIKIILLATLIAFSAGSLADQRFETVGGFCHFILNAANDDNEVFFANCENSITQNDDGTGTGSTLIRSRYLTGTAPIDKTTVFSGAATGIPCVMVDSNGTAYTTNDWDSKYTFSTNPKEDLPDLVAYSIVCRNGQQQ